jgi:TorA maturation chaperone TorD
MFNLNKIKKNTAEMVYRNGIVEMANLAGARAILYDLLVKILNQLPDEDFLKKIEDRVFEDMFHRFSGVEHIMMYRSQMGRKSPEDLITELSVDRTKILRGTGPKELKPPHEVCYVKDSDMGSTVMKLRRFYRSAGMIPDETISESPDYLCVELDFMKNLCLCEKGQWESGEGASKTLFMEKSFLNEHLGCWIGDFCSVAWMHAITDFYRGFSEILNSAIVMELGYVNNLPKDIK